MMMRIAKNENGRAIKSLELMEIIVLKYFNKSVFQWFSTDEPNVTCYKS